ncbi:MAG: hypothetical protein GXP58_04900 [Deltaproteobacteria bacterium]|nr:hypothetical protein [Deltaproteobacteria bacterium]
MLCLMTWMAMPASLSAAEKNAGEMISDKTAGTPATVAEADQQLIRTVAMERVNLDMMRRNLILRQNRLKQTRKEIEGRIQDLLQLRKEVDAKIQTLQNVGQKEMQHLVKVYEAMSPEEAAPLMEGLKQNIAVELLSRMRDKKAGKILELVQKKKAEALTEVLARRKKLNSK